MRLENEFLVPAPIDRTWAVLLDLPRVAGCLPGATIEPIGEEGSFRGQLKLKVGPVNLAYSGTVRPLDVDADEHVASFEARAKETRGTGTAAAVIRNSLTSENGATRVRLQTDLDVTGRPAQFGRGLMQDVAGKLLGEFANRMSELMQEPEPDASPDATAPGELSEAPGVSPPAPAQASPPRIEPATGAARETESAQDGDQLDVGSLLFSSYRRQGALALVTILVLAALRALRPKRGFEITIRYRL